MMEFTEDMECTNDEWYQVEAQVYVDYEDDGRPIYEVTITGTKLIHWEDESIKTTVKVSNEIEQEMIEHIEGLCDAEYNGLIEESALQKVLTLRGI